jgi:amidase
MNLSEYAAHDALALMNLMRSGEVSARELHDTALAAIEALNPRLNAVVTRAEADATHALANLDMAAPFAGLPFLMKDGGVMAGQRLVMGAKFARDLLCPADAEFTRRLKRSGVVILGSTNAPELGNSCTTENLLDGPARNPWNMEHSTGGSSGGSSAAVAAGIVPVAHTSDGGGSIRTPAHCCGVFGLKPSRGRNPSGPQDFGGTFGYGVHHVSTRSVRDSAAFLDVLHGDEPGAWYRVAPPARPFAQEVGADPGRLRIAFSSVSPSPFATSPDCVAAVSEAARLCERLGHHVEEAAPDYDWEAFRSAFHDNWVAGIPFRMARLESLLGIKIGPEHLEPCNWTNLQYARTMTIDQHQLSMARLFALTRDV